MVIVTSFRPAIGKGRFQLCFNQARPPAARFGNKIFFRLSSDDLRRALQLGPILACVVVTKTMTMKTNHLLFLLGSLVLTTIGHADDTDTKTFVLPTYVVTAPRTLPTEQSINNSLAAFRQQSVNRVLTSLQTGQALGKNLLPVHLAATTPTSLSRSADKAKS
jgi:hypothetical protein